jgi:hypothetical protein
VKLNDWELAEDGQRVVPPAGHAPNADAKRSSPGEAAQNDRSHLMFKKRCWPPSTGMSRTSKRTAWTRSSRSSAGLGCAPRTRSLMRRRA